MIKQPFGCAVFDSLLSASLPMRYSVSGKTFYQLEQEDTVSRRAILVVNNHLALTDVDVNALLKRAERGNKIMLVSNSFTGTYGIHWGLRVATLILIRLC